MNTRHGQTLDKVWILLIPANDSMAHYNMGGLIILSKHRKEQFGLFRGLITNQGVIIYIIPALGRL